MKVTVIGCGRWGTFLAWYISTLGHSTRLFGRASSPRMAQLLLTRKNGLITLNDDIGLITTLADESPDLFVISVGSQALRGLISEHKCVLRGKNIVLCMKGLEIGTGNRLSEIVKEELGEEQPVAVWLGPGHVQAFVEGVPNCMVIDSSDYALKRELISALSSELIRFYYGRDILGNEIGGASKNVIGIAAGMLDGLGLSTLKGALMSRGTREIARLIAAMGGSELSAYGLCHLGDYEATVFSPYSRNRAFGESYVKGEEYSQLAEGYYTASAIMILSETYSVELPICEAVYRILYEGVSVKAALDRLFGRSLKDEF